MGSRGKLLFDLNEPPAEEVEENESAFCFQPQRAVPSSSAHTSDLFTSPTSSQRIVNDHAFSHASSVLGFQPFIRSKGAEGSEVFVEQKRAEDMNSLAVSSNPSNGAGVVAVSQLDLDSGNPQVVEKEEGEWSDAEGSTDAYNSNSLHQRPTTDNNKAAHEKGVGNSMSQNNSDVAAVNNSWNGEGVKCESNNNSTLGLDADTSDRKSCGSRNSEGSCKGDVTMDGQEDSGLLSKQKDIKGVEASHALKLANNPVKRPKVDQQEAMLGKKRSRQTMFLNLEDVKQAGSIKTSTPRRPNFPAPVTTRIVRETLRPLLASTERTGEKQLQPAMKDSKQVELSYNEGNNYVESNDPKTECNGEMNSGLLARPRRLNSSMDLASEDQPTTVSRQSSWKVPMDSKQLKNTPVSGRKPAIVGQNSIDFKSGAKKLPSKKPPAVTNQYQDTSVKRLLREVTNEKFWHHPGPRIAEGIPTTPCGGIPTLRRAGWLEENYSHSKAEAESASVNIDSPPSMKKEIIRKKKFESLTISQALVNPTGIKIIFESDDEEEDLESAAEEEAPAEVTTPTDEMPTTTIAPILKVDAKTWTDPKVNSDRVKCILQKMKMDLYFLKCDMTYLESELKMKIDVVQISLETMKKFFEIALDLSVNSRFAEIIRMCKMKASTSEPPKYEDWKSLSAAVEAYKIKEREAEWERLQALQEERKRKVIIELLTADRDRLRAKNLRYRALIMEEVRRGYIDLAPSESDDNPRVEEPAEDNIRAHPPIDPPAVDDPPAE